MFGYDFMIDADFKVRRSNSCQTPEEGLEEEMVWEMENVTNLVTTFHLWFVLCYAVSPVTSCSPSHLSLYLHVFSSTLQVWLIEINSSPGVAVPLLRRMASDIIAVGIAPRMSMWQDCPFVNGQVEPEFTAGVGGGIPGVGKEEDEDGYQPSFGQASEVKAPPQQPSPPPAPPSFFKSKMRYMRGTDGKMEAVPEPSVKEASFRSPAKSKFQELNGRKEEVDVTVTPPRPGFRRRLEEKTTPKLLKCGKTIYTTPGGEWGFERIDHTVSAVWNTLGHRGNHHHSARSGSGQQPHPSSTSTSSSFSFASRARSHSTGRASSARRSEGLGAGGRVRQVEHRGSGSSRRLPVDTEYQSNGLNYSRASSRLPTRSRDPSLQGLKSRIPKSLFSVQSRMGGRSGGERSGGGGDWY